MMHWNIILKDLLRCGMEEEIHGCDDVVASREHCIKKFPNSGSLGAVMAGSGFTLLISKPGPAIAR
jgi:hypothetical protein